MTDHNNAAIELRNRKRQLRQSAELLRQKIKPQHPDAGARVVQHLLQDLRSKDPATWTAGTVVSSYHQRGSEMDMTDLNAALVEAGYDLALPVVLGRGHPLAFRRYRPGDDLTKGVLEVMEPLPTAPILVPKILLLPLLAFDRQGNRLGYGGGYYDRTMQTLRAEAKAPLFIGVAYSWQEVKALPAEPHDAKLDGILTELGVSLFP